jgi:TP53 regulating kinase and related kinases
MLKGYEFVLGDKWTLISQGAEARIWVIPKGSSEHNFAADVIAKERFPKSYRHPVLDERLTKQRCRAEARILGKCAQKGMDVPAVLLVRPPVLYLEYVKGITIRDRIEELIHDLSMKSEVHALATKIGAIVGTLHSLGIVHGDLTTSNIMLREVTTVNGSSETGLNKVAYNNSVLLIDFGLAKNSESAEERAVDLYVLERALSSTHPSLPDDFLEAMFAAYSTTASKVDSTLERLSQVQKRGRKRECFG